VDHAIFDSYGNRTNADTFGSAFQWTGVYRDPVTGLQWNRARWYNPGAGKGVRNLLRGYASCRIWFRNLPKKQEKGS
jgi:hypothetical protein